jgi:hypothetical protein
MSFTKLSLQERDFNILRSLATCRIMTNRQIAGIFFQGRREAAKKRLQKLKAAGFIKERSRKVYDPAVLSLTSAAFVFLSNNGHLSALPHLSKSTWEKRSEVSDRTLMHELEVIDVKTAFHRVMHDQQAIGILKFETWPLLNQFSVCGAGSRVLDTLVKPDGFIAIQQQLSNDMNLVHNFFLELDRSTEGQDVLVSKAIAYSEYYRSGGFAQRSGALRTEYKKHPFRVLIVFKSTERRNNFAQRILSQTPRILTQLYLSTFDEVVTRPLDSIWMRPVDFRKTIGLNPPKQPAPVGFSEICRNMVSLFPLLRTRPAS